MGTPMSAPAELAPPDAAPPAPAAHWLVFTAALSDGATVPDGATLSEGATPSDGALQFRVHASRPGMGAAHAAIALDHFDPWLEAFDLWFGQPLDWRWQRETPLPAITTARADCVPAGQPATAEAPQLVVPWALLRRLAPPPAPLADHLRWHDVQSVLTLSRMTLTSDELSDLEPRGAVVLADSMQPDWHGSLRLAAEPEGAGLAIDLSDPLRPRLAIPPGAAPDAATRPVATVAHTSAAESPNCEIRLAAPAPLPVALLAGWAADPTVPAGSGRTELWFAPDPAMPLRRLAVGQLIPWGHGWAMLLD